MEQKFYDAVAASPVIAAVKNMEGLEQCLATDTIQVVFLLFGDICSIGNIVARVKQAGKLAMVHADLVTGLSGSKEIAVDFLHSATQTDGIISTRQSFIRRAKELGVPVAALVGGSEPSMEAAYAAGVSGIFPINPYPAPLQEVMPRCGEHLAFAARNLLHFVESLRKMP